jgi:hypothetical protein
VVANDVFERGALAVREQLRAVQRVQPRKERRELRRGSDCLANK